MVCRTLGIRDSVSSAISFRFVLEGGSDPKDARPWYRSDGRLSYARGLAALRGIVPRVRVRIRVLLPVGECLDSVGSITVTVTVAL